MELLRRQEGPVAVLTMNRPQTLNALTPTLAEAITGALDEIREDASVRAVVLTGAGGAFCSGIDLSGLMELIGQGADPGRLRASSRQLLAGQLHGAVRALWYFPKPTIAAVQGAAVGFGLDLAAACDLRVVAQDAKLSYPFVRRGLVPDGGTGHTLPRLIGLGRALELVLTGDTVDGARAEALGLANRVVEAARVEATAVELAGRLAENSLGAMAAAKDRLKANESLEDELGRVVELATRQGASPDALEGIAAFLEKRPPKFRG